MAATSTTTTAARPAPEPAPFAAATRRLLAGACALALLGSALALAPVDVDWEGPAGADRRMAALLDASVADPSEAQLAQARAALDERPLDGRALRVLSVGAARAGEHERAAQLLALAVRRWPRDPAGRALAAEQAFAAGDPRAALEHLDALMRAAPALRPATLSLLAAHLGDAAVHAALLERLALSPPWRGALVPALDAAQPAHALALLDGLAERLPPTPPELALRLRLLQGQGRADLARATWLASLPPDDADRSGAPVYDGGFEHAATEGGFGWQLQAPPGVGIERDAFHARAGGHALLLRFDGRAVRFDGLRQMLALAPGRYRLAWSSDNAVDTTRPFEWTLACGPGDAVALRAPLSASAGWQAQQAVFELPAGCTMQRLQLRHTARSLAERRLRGSLWMDEVGIFPIP